MNADSLRREHSPRVHARTDRGGRGGQGPVAGLYPHGQALYPIYSAPALRGPSAAVKEPFFVLSELAGQSVGLAATRVLGVHGPFSPSPESGEEGFFRAKAVSGNVHFLDFQRMFC